MQTPADLLKQGDLDAALRAANQAVRNAPADARQRLFLFQLNCILSRWDKAIDQLSIYADLCAQDPDARLRARLYQATIQCEVFRTEVFTGKRTPLLLGAPQDWLGYLIQANHLLADGKHKAAAALRDQAFDAAPAIPGSIDQKPFAWLADADTRLGPVLELYMDGKYYWVPFANIRRLALEAPNDLCDLVFAPVQIKWTNGGEAAGFIPARYAPAKENNVTDPLCALSRRTDWCDLPGPFATGNGQRMFATDTEEIPLLETRIIDFTTS